MTGGGVQTRWPVRTGRVGGILLVACLAACSRGPQRHNVLLISLDSTRRDLVGAYGHQAPHAPGLSSSPNIDRLAREGVLFERAYATTSWTLPSHVTLFTGQPELVHGVDFDTHEQDPRWASLAEVLSEAGYRTAGFFSGPYLEPHFGFDRGFETYRAGYGPNVESTSEELARAKSALAEAEAAGDEALAAQRRAEAGEIQSRLETLSHRDVSSKSVTEAGLAELAAAAEDGRPFFLFLHYFDPHYDYLPPEPWDTAFDPDYDGAIDGEDFYVSDKISVIDPARPWKRRQVVSPRDLEHVLALYAGELAWTDAQIGRLREALERHELLEETIVVITSDHGDQFFEHGSLGHRENLFEESTRVPLVLRLPEPHPRGVRIDALVSNADVFPSLLELLDLPPPQGLTSRSFVPLLPDADGAGVADGAERDVLGRVVAMHRSVIRLEGSRVTLPAVLVRVIETYHRGTIKITRERVAKTARPGAPGARRRGGRATPTRGGSRAARLDRPGAPSARTPPGPRGELRRPAGAGGAARLPRALRGPAPAARGGRDAGDRRAHPGAAEGAGLHRSLRRGGADGPRRVRPAPARAGDPRLRSSPRGSDCPRSPAPATIGAGGIARPDLSPSPLFHRPRALPPGRHRTFS